MQHVNHTSASKASDVLRVRADRLSCDLIRSRAASPSSGSRDTRPLNALHPAAKASGLRAGTTMPVSPTTNAESPTSVTTHGTAHAIASTMAFEVASPYEE